MEPDHLAELPPGLLEDFVSGLAIMDGRGLTEGFGHLSARVPGGVLITPALAPGLATPADLLLLGPGGEVQREAAGRRPALETPLHLAIYESRPDCGAICRTHSPWAVAWGLRAEAFLPAHGFGLMLGESVPYCSYGDLVTTREAGAAVATVLGGAHGLFLKGNGLLVLGATVPEAVIKALYLEEACAAVLRSGGVGKAAVFGAAERLARSGWHAAELARAWSYYSARPSARMPK